MSNAFVYLRPLNLTFIRAQGPYAEASAEAWARVFDWLDKSGHRQSAGCGYGLMLDDPRTTPPEKCRYDACIEMADGFQDSISREFGFRRLPGGAYARRRHIGPAEGGVTGLVATLRDQWAPQNGLLIDTKRPVIEIYLDNPAKVPAEKRRIDICLPVAASARSEAPAA